ncbi:MAG: hypothetical protein ABI835_15345 [Chloroflexota bacterium]
MFLNQSDTRLSDERRKDLQREAKQQRLAKESRQPQRKDRKQSPLWTRVWTLL